jgi:NAD(P)H-dependent FMN reductase
MMRMVVMIVMGLWVVAPVWSASIPIENASFETPLVDPNGFGAVPLVDGWTELDLDTLGSTNTGVFANTAMDSPDHVANADGVQLAFLGSQLGNGLQQTLSATYSVGCDYRLALGVGVSMRFPPSADEPVDTIELVLYYHDEAGSVVDIASTTVEATGLSATQLEDFSLYLPAVDSEEPWAGKRIGVAIRAAGMAGGFWTLDHVRLVESLPVSIPVENASFETPVVDPNGFGALPVVDGWTEIDLDTLGSTNTGVFANTAADSPDHVANADGDQLAFLGSELGNGLQQELSAAYTVGCDYRLTVGVGVSMRFPPSAAEPLDTIELVLYYQDETASIVDIASARVEATDLSTTQLEDFSVYLPTIISGEAWAGKMIGVAIRATGMAGGFWTLDHVRLVETMPVSIPVENASFESPVVDPNGFGALPIVDGWTELDLDTLGSTNTGVFANTAADSPDHVANTDGDQLAFLGSELGNSLQQELAATYTMGCGYRLTVGIGVSMRFPPSAVEPVDTIELVLYYHEQTESVVDIASATVEATGLSTTHLEDFSVYLPTISSTEAWAGKPIGVAIRATGLAGGFWTLDHVRLAESMPIPDFANTGKE